MSGINSQKTPLAYSLNTWSDRKLDDAQQQLGQALPASVVSVSGSIVTVKFEINSTYTLPQVQMPLFGPEYIRYPIQVGDKGYAIPADAYLGGMSGLGDGTADLSATANLASLVFFPIGNKNFTPSGDTQAVVIYGPNGVIIRDTNSGATVHLTPTTVTTTVGSNSVVVNSSGITLNGPVTINGVVTGSGGTVNFGGSHLAFGSATSAGDVTAGGKSLETHIHSGVQTGGSDTGPPV